MTALLQALRTSRLVRWAIGASAALGALLLALANERRAGRKHGRREARDEIQEDTYEHVIERHEKRDRVDEAIRNADADDIRERLRDRFGRNG